MNYIIKELANMVANIALLVQLFMKRCSGWKNINKIGSSQKRSMDICSNYWPFRTKGETKLWK